MMTMGINDIVGKISGTIYASIAHEFSIAPLLLVPAITFKVRKAMQNVNVDRLTDDQKEELAQEIQISIIPMLFSYDIEEPLIRKITPAIKSAALKALAFL